jgi:hypothetical protein
LPGRKLRKISNDLKAASHENGVPIDDADGPIERVLVRTEPTLLVQMDGHPKFKTISGTSLSYVVNAPQNIYLDQNTHCYYVHFGNQWYMSRHLRDSIGWSAVERPQLPHDLLISIHEPEARLDEEAPQVAKIDREATTTVDYSSAPRFKPIPGTQLEYATNTCSIVINDNGIYYALDNGVWFVAGSPLGVWRVSDIRPTGVELIPRLNPVYKAKFVYIYQTAPAYVYEGYLPGYDAGPTDGCAMAETYDPDWMDAAWGYDLDYVFDWGGGWYNGYYRFDKKNRYYGHMVYGKKRTGGWGQRTGGVLHGMPASSGGGVARGGYSGGGARGSYASGGGSHGSYAGGGGSAHVSSGGGGGGGSAHVSSGGGGGGGGGGAHH